MNANDILKAISDIDPKYIEEAATPLADDSNRKAGIISIESKRTLRKLLYVALPSVAAVLLILAVAIPAILRVGKSESAAPAAADSTAAPVEMADAASDAAAEEAAPVSEEPAFAPEAASESSEPSADSSQTAGTNEYSLSPDYESGDMKDKRGDEAETNEAAAEESEDIMPSPVAEYENGILTIETSELLHMSLKGQTYKIYDTADTYSSDPVASGLISDLTSQEEAGTDPLVLDLTSLKLTSGDYRIDMKIGTAEFTVP